MGAQARFGTMEPKTRHDRRRTDMNILSIEHLTRVYGTGDTAVP